MKNLIAVTLASIISLSTAHASELASWMMYFGNTTLKNDAWKIHHELQYRNHKLTQDMDQLLIRTGLQYQVKEVGTFTAGYAHVITEDMGEIDNRRKENRIYQEFLLPQTVKLLNVKHRFRYEQRFFDNNRINTRYRYSIAMDFPIYRLHQDRNVYASMYNEIFIHGRKRPSTGDLYDRNRLYVGMGLKWNRNVSVQLGYMQQMFIQHTDPKVMLSLHHNLFM